MLQVAIWLAVAVVAIVAVVMLKRARDRRELERYSITPEELHVLMEARQDVVVMDVRLPLDLLADSEIIRGAVRIPPKEILANPAVIPAEKDSVVYCTCPSEETSRTIMKRALALGISRIRFLKGGLAGWKAKGFPVVPYDQPFRLDVAG
jgi:rhodanese-related sulfurtransferase